MSEHEGVGVTPLSGVGTARWYVGEVDLPEQSDTTDPAAERERFEQAREAARDELEAETDRLRERAGESEAAVLEAHVDFLTDPQVTEEVRAAIDDGAAAPHAVASAFDRYVEQFEGMEGRMAERADDLRDVRDRLLRLLVGEQRTDLGALPDDTVLLAERLAPSDTARLDPDRVAGIATVAGGRTSHAAIVARSLAIPAVVGVGEGLREVADGASVLVDGDRGVVVTDPSDDQRAAAGGVDAPVRADPVTTADGEAVEVAANVGTVADLDPAVERGADGVGLFRSEFLFLDRESPPDEGEQVEAYAAALDAFPDGRVVVRTLDVGGDKPVPYLDVPETANPYLGERGVRRSLGRDRDLFDAQLRALCRAAAVGAGDLAVMFPMVATVSELDAALDAVEDALDALAAEDVPHERPELGVMVETPAATHLAGEFADRVEFLSVGTNDLTQYVMAAARDDERVADLHDPLHPPVLRAVRRTVEGAGDDAWVGMCGEMAGDPDLTRLLLGLGLDELSMSAVTVPAVKARVAETDTAAARDLADRALAAETRDAVRDLL